MVIYSCNNCNWIGKQDQRKCVVVTPEFWYFICPKCDNKEFTKIIPATIECPKCKNSGMDFEDVSYYYSKKEFVGSITEFPHDDYKVTCHKCNHILRYGNQTH